MRAQLIKTDRLNKLRPVLFAYLIHWRDRAETIPLIGEILRLPAVRTLQPVRANQESTPASRQPLPEWIDCQY
jgi:hypothetical protein